MDSTLDRSGLNPKYPGGKNDLLPRLLLRYRSSAETEHEQATLRLFLTCIGILYLWLIAHYNIIGTASERAEVIRLWGRWWFPSIFFLFALMHIVSLLVNPARLILRRNVMLFLDNAFITILAFHGGLFTPFVALYFWIAIGYGFRYGPNWLVFSASSSVIFISLAFYLVPTWNAGSTAGLAITLSLSVASCHAYHLLRRLKLAQQKLVLKATELENLATRDSLTGLANRALLMDRLGHAITLAARKDGDVAVLFIDVDGMKMVNDRIGHAAGDALLIEVAKKLQARLRAVDTFARIAGDEFVIILEGITDRQSVLNVADIVLEEVCSVTSIAGQAIKISASIGIAWLSSIPRMLWKPDTLLAAADDAMYAAKRSGKNRYCIAAVNVP